MMMFGVIAELPDVVVRRFPKKKTMAIKNKLCALQFYKSKKNGRWYWKVTSANGKKVANCSGGKDSGYASESAAKKGYVSTKKLMDLIKL